MKTSKELVKTALKSEEDFKSAVIDLLADIRNSIITAILSRDPIGVIANKKYESVYRQMRRLLSEEIKDKESKS